MFSGCTGLKSIVLPNSITAIGNSAFKGSGLTSITIPNSVTSIGNSAFYGCKSLISATIPNSVTTIGQYAFSDVNWNMKQIISKIKSPASVTLGGYVFRNMSMSNCTLYVPAGTLSEYEAANQWKNFLRKVEFTMGDVDGSETLDVTDVVLLASHVMGETPDNFDVFVADMDDSGTVDVTDVVMLAEIAMGS